MTGAEQKKGFCGSITNLETAKRWTLLGLGLIGLALSIASITTCNFISLDHEEEGRVLIMKGFGIFFSLDEDGQCKGYRNRTGGAHAMAKAFGLLAVISIGTAVTCVLGAVLLLKDKLATFAWYSARALFAGGLYSVLLTFFLYASPLKRSTCGQDGVQCRAGPGAIITAVNSVLLAGVVILSMLTGGPHLDDKTNEQTTTARKIGPEDEEVGSTLTWFSSNAKATTEPPSSEVVVAESSNQKQQRGWFGSKGMAAAAAGGAAVATAVAATKLTDQAGSQHNVFGTSKVQNSSNANDDVVVESSPSCDQKRIWFGSKGKVASADSTAAVASGNADENSLRTLFGGKNVDSTAALASGKTEDKSRRSIFGSKKTSKSQSSDNLPESPSAPTSTNVHPESTSDQPKRSGFAAMFRPKSKRSSEITNVDDMAVKIDPSNNAETRRALFASDAETTSTVEPILGPNNQRTENAKPDETVTVVNESVSSSCPTCYCLP